jgi:hypothetical protein
MRKTLLIVWISVLIHFTSANQLLADKANVISSQYSIDRVLDMRGCVQKKKPKTGDSISYAIQGPILQNHLIELSRSKDIVRFRCDIDPTWQSRLRKYYIKLNSASIDRNANKNTEIAGLLFAVSDSGCFLYDWETSIGTYVPYRMTSVINKGVPPKTVVRKIMLGTTVLGGSIGLVGGASSGDFIDAGPGVLIGSAVGLFVGAYFSLYYVVIHTLTTISPDVRYNVKSSVQRGGVFRQKMKTHRNLKRGIDIDQFALDSSWRYGWRDLSMDTSKDANTWRDTQILEPVVLSSEYLAIDSNSMKVDSLITKNNTPKEVEPSVVDPVIVPKNVIGEFQGAKGINANWMFDGFNSGEVRTSYLINQYTWIRQREISEADLKKVKNKSEIQFLAMWVATSAGYHFREVVEFDKDQLAFLLPKEPYLAEAVTKDFYLDPQIIVDLDLVNLRWLYESLKMK